MLHALLCSLSLVHEIRLCNRVSGFSFLAPAALSFNQRQLILTPASGITATRLPLVMVLVTSSTISVAISGAVVSLFTFLLFLSGYVLQQQTVRSLQEALRNPPAPTPTPTLPPQFETAAVLTEAQVAAIGKALEDARSGLKSHEHTLVELESTVLSVGVPLPADDQQHVLVAQDARADAPLGTQSKLDSTLSDSRSSLQEAELPVVLSNDISASAYILPLFTPASVCAALLFAKQKQSSTHHISSPIIIFYPSTWDYEPGDHAVAALDLLRSAVDEHSHTYGRLILHPVQVNKIWSGAGMLDGQYISEISRSRWSFDRLLYLRLPGIALDISALDYALFMSDARRGWAPLSSSTKSLNLISNPPSLLLWSSDRGVLTPRGEMRRLVTTMSTSHTNRHENEMEVEAKAGSRGAAWIALNEAELKHHRSEKEWFGGMVERFERGREDVCQGSILLED